MDLVIDLFVNSPLFIVKLFILLLEIIYIGFAFVLYRQEKLMSATIEVPRASFFAVLTLTHFFSSIAVVIVTFFLL